MDDDGLRCCWPMLSDAGRGKGYRCVALRCDLRLQQTSTFFLLFDKQNKNKRNDTKRDRVSETSTTSTTSDINHLI
jgi:hypothetical protein